LTLFKDKKKTAFHKYLFDYIQTWISLIYLSPVKHLIYILLKF